MSIITMVLDFVTALLNLLESEARILRRAVMRLGWGLAFIVIAAVLALVAAGFFLWGLYQYLAALLSPAGAAFVVSFAALVFAVAAAGLARWRGR